MTTTEVGVGNDGTAPRAEVPGPSREETLREQALARPDVVWDIEAGKPRSMNIHERMAAILTELPAIGKDSYNEQQKFSFRGYDDALNALNPLLAKYRVYYVPEVIERERRERTTRQGGIMYEVALHVRFTFYGPAGDCVVGTAWGEGTDMADKSTPKAHTGSMKVMLFEAFAISTEESKASDPDATGITHDQESVTPPPPPDPEVASPGMIATVKERLTAYGVAHGAAPPEWTAKQFPKVKALQEILDGNRPPPHEPTLRRWSEVLDAAEGAAEAERIKNTPCEVCGSTRSERVVHEGLVRCARRNDCDERKARQDAKAAEGGEAAGEGPGDGQEGPQEPGGPDTAPESAPEPETGS